VFTYFIRVIVSRFTQCACCFLVRRKKWLRFLSSQLSALIFLSLLRWSICNVLHNWRRSGQRQIRTTQNLFIHIFCLARLEAQLLPVYHAILNKMPNLSLDFQIKKNNSCHSIRQAINSSAKQKHYMLSMIRYVATSNIRYRASITKWHQINVLA